MALGMYFTPSSFTPARYDDAIKRLEEAGAGSPPGRLYHVAMEADGLIQVFDVWESEATFQAFGETLLPIMYHFGVHEGRIPITRLVDLLAERPAKIFGLYPRKGTWQVGADADVVLVDPKGSTAITASTQHSRAGYTAYEGMQLQGRVVHTIQRGRTVFERGTLRARPGWGEFLRREGVNRT